MNANQAALTMSLEEYRRWWYRQFGEIPPAEGERLTVAQERDERLIRDGYHHRRTHLKPKEARPLFTDLEARYEALCKRITLKTAEYKRVNTELEALHAEAEDLEYQIANWEGDTSRV